MHAISWTRLTSTQVHPFNTRTAIRQICQENNIVVEAYAPLVRALKMNDKTVKSLATKYKATSGQLLIRWSLQHGMIPLPKSVHRDRIEENSKVGHFEIEKSDMEKLDALDEYLVTGKCFCCCSLQF